MAKEKSKILHFPTLSRFNSEDWEMRLELIGVPIAVSPLHDKDLSDIEDNSTKSTLSCDLCGEKSCDC